MTPTTARTSVLAGFPDGEMLTEAQVIAAYTKALGTHPTDRPVGFRVGGQLQCEAAEVRIWIEAALKARQQREAEGRDDDGLTAQQREEMQREAAERAAHRNAMSINASRERFAFFRSVEAQRAAEREAEEQAQANRPIVPPLRGVA